MAGLAADIDSGLEEAQELAEQLDQVLVRVMAQIQESGRRGVRLDATAELAVDPLRHARVDVADLGLRLSQAELRLRRAS